MAVQPIPDGYHSVTVHLTVQRVAKLLEFLKQAFGARERGRHVLPDGRIMHAEVKIGDSIVMLGEQPDPSQTMPACLYLYVPDIDAVYERALEAGAKSLRAPADEFYGDRKAGVQDPSGNSWWIATHIKDPTPEDLAKGMATHGK